eukprot:jgi/Mesvir1/6416/Mv19508-RA.1
MGQAFKHRQVPTARTLALVGVLYLSIALVVAGKNLLGLRNVPTLTAENFERRTQAASGQTSGHWLIFFCSSHSIQCPMNVPVIEEIAAAGLDVSVAYVDVDTDRPLAKRFGIRTRPALILLRNGKMFRFGGSFAGPSLKNKPAVNVAEAVEAVAKFVQAPYSESQPEAVPPEPGIFVVVIDAMVTHLRAGAGKLQEILPAWLFAALPFLILAAVAPLAYYTVVPAKSEDAQEKEKEKEEPATAAGIAEATKRTPRKNARMKRAE